MAENEIKTNETAASEHASTGPAVTPRTFTQDDVNAIAAKEAGKAERSILKALGLTDKAEISSLIDQLTGNKELSEKFNAVNAKYNAAAQKIAALTLKSHGVNDADEQEFYTFKINKLVDDNKDFATAAEEYFRDHPINKATVQLVGDVTGSTKHATSNDAMNSLIRGAKK